MTEAAAPRHIPEPQDLHDAPATTAIGRVELIVRRPARDEREVIAEAELDPVVGLVGDRWGMRDLAEAGPAYLASQVTIMSTRVLAAIEPDRDRWPLAGDQLYADLDLAAPGLEPGARITVGSAVLEVSAAPHTGCAKFRARFGEAAFAWVDSPEGRAARRRGLNARVVQGGTVRVGDTIRRA